MFFPCIIGVNTVVLGCLFCSFPCIIGVYTVVLGCLFCSFSLSILPGAALAAMHST